MLTIDTSRPDVEVAEAWIACTTRSNPHQAHAQDAANPSSEAEDDWGVQALLEIVCEEPIRALEITFLIAQMTDDAWLLCNLGAGPIESLLAHDATLLDPIALEARNSLNLKTALASVWQNAMPEATWRAVQHIART